MTPMTNANPLFTKFDGTNTIGEEARLGHPVFATFLFVHLSSCNASCPLPVTTTEEPMVIEDASNYSPYWQQSERSYTLPDRCMPVGHPGIATHPHRGVLVAATHGACTPPRF